MDDKSTDETVEIARELPLEVIWHPHNVGYGANQKTCYLHALQRGADIVVMLHPDGQYEPSLIPALVTPIMRGQADLVLGSRLAVPGQAREGGMPFYKYVSNRFLTSLESGAMRTQLTDLHTGYRAYSRELLLTVPFLRNSLDFAFDYEMLMQASAFGFRIVEVPARSVYTDDTSSITLWARQPFTALAEDGMAFMPTSCSTAPAFCAYAAASSPPKGATPTMPASLRSVLVVLVCVLAGVVEFGSVNAFVEVEVDVVSGFVVVLVE